MEKIEKLLKHVQITNPQMTKKKLLEELCKCRYSAVALCMVCENDKKPASCG